MRTPGWGGRGRCGASSAPGRAPGHRESGCQVYHLLRTCLSHRGPQASTSRCSAPPGEEPSTRDAAGFPLSPTLVPPHEHRGHRARSQELPTGIIPCRCPRTALQKNLKSQLLVLARLTQRCLRQLKGFIQSLKLSKETALSGGRPRWSWGGTHLARDRGRVAALWGWGALPHHKPSPRF